MRRAPFVEWVKSVSKWAKVLIWSEGVRCVNMPGTKFTPKMRSVLAQQSM